MISLSWIRVASTAMEVITCAHKTDSKESRF
jgi:hypothetical protein